MATDVAMVKVTVFPDGRMDAANAARFLGLSSKTLANKRSTGTGPRFVKQGRIFYFEDDLKAWLAEQPRVRSSAQAAVANRSSACAGEGDAP